MSHSPIWKEASVFWTMKAEEKEWVILLLRIRPGMLLGY